MFQTATQQNVIPGDVQLVCALTHAKANSVLALEESYRRLDAAPLSATPSNRLEEPAIGYTGCSITTWMWLLVSVSDCL